MSRKKNIIQNDRTEQGRGFDVQAWIRGHPGLLLAGLLVLYAGLSLLMFDPKPFVGGDNAAYVALSKSLVLGKGLTEIWTPEAKPHTQYPFGFPLLLAPVSLLKLPYVWYKLIPWLSGLLSLLTFGLLIKEENKTVYLLPVMLLAVNPYFLEYAHWVLSELSFTLFILLSFLLLRRWEKTGGYFWLAAVIISAVFANCIRSAGIALYLGVFLYLLFKRKFREAGIFIAGCIVLTMPWAMRNSHYGTSGGYLDQFLMRDPYQPELGYLGLAGLSHRFAANIRIYFAAVMPRMLFPSLDGWNLSGAAPMIMLTMIVPALAALAVRLAKKAAGYDWFALAYLGMSLLWPEAWSDVRFLLPLLPFLLFYLARAYGYLIRSLFKNSGLWPAGILSAFLVISNFAADRQLVSNNLSAGKTYSQDKYSGYDPAWRSFFTAAEWVRNNTPPGSVVVSRKPTLFFLGSERRAYCYPFTAERDSMLRSLDKADFVMVEPVSGTGQRFLIPAVQPLLDKKYKVIYAQGNPQTYILQVMKDNR